jgi:hypothetical protein
LTSSRLQAEQLAEVLAPRLLGLGAALGDHHFARDRVDLAVFQFHFQLFVVAVGQFALYAFHQILFIQLHGHSLVQKIWENSQNSEPDNRIATGKVSTQAMARLRTVDHCRPERLAAIVPATPDDSTCVVDTGRP